MTRRRKTNGSATGRSRWQWLKDAFSLEPDHEPLSDEQVALLDRIARFLARRHMTVPAIMFLESVRPMNYLGSQVMAFFEPVVKVLFTAKEYTELRLILERRQSIEVLLQRIEHQETNRLQAKQNTVEKAPSISAQTELDPLGEAGSGSDGTQRQEVHEDR